MTHPDLRQLAVLLLVAAAGAVPGRAAASPLFEIAGAATGHGGLSGRVSGAGAASTYFNPALLPDAPEGLELGMMVLSDQISLTLDGRPGGDVPVEIGARTALDPRTRAPIPNDTMPTTWLERGCPAAQCPGQPLAARPRQAQGSSGNVRQYGVVGLVSRIRDPWLVLGVHAIIPGQDFTTVGSNYPDEREQFFSNSLHPELYSDSLTATSLAFGVGSRPVPWLSFGVSFTLSLTNSAAARTYVRDPVDYRLLQLDNEIRVTTGVAPHFGVAVDPSDRLRLSATLHTEQKLVIHTGIAATLPSGSESSVELTETHHFVPWTAAVGGEAVALRTERDRLALSWGFALAAWSTYVGAHGERPGSGPVDLGFRDILRSTAGVRYDRGGLRTHADAQLHPSPVPAQVGRTNYVDNDRVGIALGASHAVTVLGFSLRPGVTVVGHRLLPRHQQKRDELLRDEVPDGAVDRDLRPLPGTRGLQTNNPGWPGFASEGYLLGATAWVGAEY